VSCVVAALYKFVALEDYAERREPLLTLCRENGVRGTLLLAAEGINGTIAGSREGIDTVLDALRSDPRLADLEHKESIHDKPPFLRMKVKLKKEIVTLGVEGIDPNRRVGTYVNPQDWDAVAQAEDVTLIDTRNDYECAVGSFRGAIDPGITNFRDFPRWVSENLDPGENPRVAMFCTGGIRCEKASSYLLEQGFKEVYHLRGGILKYLEEVPQESSSWEGECFVFDDRVAVDHGLRRGSYDQCHACRHPITEEDKRSPLYEQGVSCPRCHDWHSQEKRERFAERQRQVTLAAQRGEQHLGQAPVEPHAPRTEEA
jgi:UPF0176 protein